MAKRIDPPAKERRSTGASEKKTPPTAAKKAPPAVPAKKSPSAPAKKSERAKPASDRPDKYLTLAPPAQEAGAVKTKPPLEFSKREQEDLLRDYTQRPREMWPLLRPGEHVRFYVREGKDESFRLGSWIVQNPYDYKTKDSDVMKRAFKLSFTVEAPRYNGRARPGMLPPGTWTVLYENIERLYAKPEASALMVLQSVKQLVPKINTAVRTLQEQIKRNEAELEKLSARVERVERSLRR
jgi:hypothetical protein